MGTLISTSVHDVETAIVVGTYRERGEEEACEDSVDELEQLCGTAGAVVVHRILCRLPKPHPGTFLGPGKVEELAALVREEKIASVVFDDELSAAQGRNLEKAIGTKVVDRTQVILDIFAQHARTREGRMQIELAQLEYLLPRLRRMWTHLERQKGGIGLRGPGEKQLEMDRRKIQQSIARHKADLETVRGRRAEQRRGRRRHGWALVSLVGYTNAGKSTLINALTDAGVLAYDKLFATLDPTTRQMKLANHQQVLLTDTVGFIRKLPHGLVESFKATLEEVVEADLLLHVVDTAHPTVDRQIEAVYAVLRELGVETKPVITVLNKMDLPEARKQAVSLRHRFQPCIECSARDRTGLTELRDLVADTLRHRHVRVRLRVPPGDGRIHAILQANATILAEDYEDDGAALYDVTVPETLLGVCRPYRIEPAEVDDDADL